MSSRNDEALLHCPRPGCYYKTVDPSNLTRHQMYHVPSKWFTCSEPGCTYRSVDSSNFKRHQLQHDPEKLKKYKDPSTWFTCSEPGCTYRSVDSSNFRRHRLKHNPEELKKCPSKCFFTCSEPGCTYRSAYSNNFERHRLQHDHPELKKFNKKARRKIRPFREPGRGYTLTYKKRRKRTDDVSIKDLTQVTLPLITTQLVCSENYEALTEAVIQNMEDNECNFCNYAKRLPRYLRIHLESCVKCTSKIEISNTCNDTTRDQISNNGCEFKCSICGFLGESNEIEVLKHSVKHRKLDVVLSKIELFVI